SCSTSSTAPPSSTPRRAKLTCGRSENRRLRRSALKALSRKRRSGGSRIQLRLRRRGMQQGVHEEARPAEDVELQLARGGVELLHIPQIQLAVAVEVAHVERRLKARRLQARDAVLQNRV